MRKKTYGKILKDESKEQYLNTVPKSYSYTNVMKGMDVTYACFKEIYIYIYI